MGQAFSTRQIVETKQAMLRARAVAVARSITEHGVLYVSHAHDIRYNEATGRGEVRWPEGGWLPLTDLGVESWANEEGLDWQKPDGTVVPAVRESESS